MWRDSDLITSLTQTISDSYMKSVILADPIKVCSTITSSAYALKATVAEEREEDLRRKKIVHENSSPKRRKKFGASKTVGSIRNVGRNDIR